MVLHLLHCAQNKLPAEIETLISTSFIWKNEIILLYFLRTVPGCHQPHVLAVCTMSACSLDHWVSSVTHQSWLSCLLIPLAGPQPLAILTLLLLVCAVLINGWIVSNKSNAYNSNTHLEWVSQFLPPLIPRHHPFHWLMTVYQMAHQSLHLDSLPSPCRFCVGLTCKLL